MFWEIVAYVMARIINGKQKEAPDKRAEDKAPKLKRKLWKMWL